MFYSSLSFKDADEDEDSPYILVSKYKDRFMKLFRRIAELKEQDPSLGRQLDKKFKLVYYFKILFVLNLHFLL